MSRRINNFVSPWASCRSGEMVQDSRELKEYSKQSLVSFRPNAALAYSRLHPLLMPRCPAMSGKSA